MIDIKDTLEKISQLERTQAQLELRATQLKEDEKKLKDKLKVLGISPTELDQKISELETTIASKLSLIHSLDKPIEGLSNGEENPG